MVQNCRFLYIPLRRLKVAIMSFSAIFLSENGPVVDSGVLWPIPLSLEYICTKKWPILQKMANSPKKWPIPRNREESPLLACSYLSWLSKVV